MRDLGGGRVVPKLLTRIISTKPLKKLEPIATNENSSKASPKNAKKKINFRSRQKETIGHEIDCWIIILKMSDYKLLLE